MTARSGTHGRNGSQSYAIRTVLGVTFFTSLTNQKWSPTMAEGVKAWGIRIGGFSVRYERAWRGWRDVPSRPTVEPININKLWMVP